jgi:hypothetical protein
VSCHGEPKTDIHAAAVTLYWSVEEFLDFREGDDLVKFVFYLQAAHAEDRAVQKDVFPVCEFGVKSGPLPRPSSLVTLTIDEVQLAVEDQVSSASKSSCDVLGIGGTDLQWCLTAIIDRGCEGGIPDP